MDFYRRHQAKNEQYYLNMVLNSGCLSERGAFHEKCDGAIRNHLRIEHINITSSGHAAIYAILTCISEPGKEVVLSPYCCPSTLNAIRTSGMQPVFAGINDTGCMSLDNIVHACNKNTIAVVVNHYGGHIYDIDLIKQYLKGKDILLIEDCATAFFSEYRATLAGTFGDFAFFSFNDKKDITCGEGGIAACNNTQYADRLKLVCSNGIMDINDSYEKKRKYVMTAAPTKLSDLVCAVLFAQLEEAPTIINRKRALYERYYSELAFLEKSGYSLPRIGDCKPNGNTFYILADVKENRDALRLKLNAAGIPTFSHYGTLVCPATTDVPLFGEDGTSFDDRLLRLPLYCDLTDEEQMFIIHSIKKLA